MIRLFIDTDVVLDFLLARQPFDQEARALWLACAQRQAIGYVTPITPVNVFYVARKQLGIIGARQLVTDILSIMKICPLDQTMVQAAHSLPMTDFEDAVQAAAAAAAGVDALVTRNTTDYANAPVPILTPAEMVARLAAA